MIIMDRKYSFSDVYNTGIDDDKLHEECGVFALFSRDNHDVSGLTYYSLYALQHRGQESVGIAVNDNGTIVYHKDMGLASEVFDNVMLEHLKGQMAIGHVRYSASGAGKRENLQPVVVKYKRGQLALAHNGSIVNAAELRSKLEENGAIFQSTSDTELMVNLISRYRVTSSSTEEAIQKMMNDIQGSYAIVVLTTNKVIGIRDPHGIRPLCIGKLDNSFILASESCAIDAIGGEFVRNVNPGEIVVISRDGLQSIQTEVPVESKLCIFEYIYFARPDSVIDGVSVHRARIEAGRRLAIEHPVDADLVIGVPDGGTDAAIGFSRESGIPFGYGLLKNKYVGRTFIQPNQALREVGAKIKYNVIRDEIEGKRIVMIDDSIVRGTTTRRIVQMLKNAGAKEVHLRISSPPFRYPCYFGVDVSSGKELVAAERSVSEINEMIGTDSLAYLSLEGLLKTPIGSAFGFCTGCFNGKYPIEIPKNENEFDNK
ncbi:MAG TPA: amidophosphoribosyltransferase [Clostridiaceae bacterium]|jgi:amidophosphoribosyltransferase|nr:amidophosphoribosyltransferase [Clostridiaceae bacterium]